MFRTWQRQLTIVLCTISQQLWSGSCGAPSPTQDLPARALSVNTTDRFTQECPLQERLRKSTEAALELNSWQGLGHSAFDLASVAFTRGQHSDQSTCVGKNGLWIKWRPSFWGRYYITELILPRSREARSLAHTRETLCEQAHSPNSSSDFATIRHHGYKSRLITKLPAGQHCQNSVPVPTQSVPRGTCRIWSRTVLGRGRYTALLFQLWSPGQLLHQNEEKGARLLIKVSQD